MHAFVSSKGIGRLPLESRILYTGFCLFLLMGYGTGVWFYIDDKLGTTPAAARSYYLGDAEAETEADGDAAATSASEVSLAAAGPAIALPSEAVGAESMRFEKPARQVIETFHFHLFSIPILLLIVSHLYIMCGIRRSIKISVLLAANASTAVHMIAPVLIRFSSEQFAFLVFPSAVLMGLTWIYMTTWPIFEMWRAVLVRGRAASDPELVATRGSIDPRQPVGRASAVARSG